MGRHADPWPLLTTGGSISSGILDLDLSREHTRPRVLADTPSHPRTLQTLDVGR
jgi:hypothetical protein